MATSIEGNRSGGFFPNTKDRPNVRENRGVDAPQLKRNGLERKTELNDMAKNDVKMNIPDSIKDFSRIKKAVDASPEIDNSEKIARLKSQIQAGTYKIDYDGLADKLLQSEF
jgi:negative regulator of flagellin synthesis FlgM